MLIHQKEELLEELCKKFNLQWSFSWGNYFISNLYPVPHGNSIYMLEINKTIKMFSRVDLDSWSTDKIEALILECALASMF